MKKIMFVLFSAALSFAVISASAQTPGQDTTKTSTQGQGSQGTQDKVKIRQGELPQSVRDAITNDKNGEYTGWQIGEAYSNSKDNSYSVELKKGTEARIVKFDARGNKVEE
jgi:hypothetical protein